MCAVATPLVIAQYAISEPADIVSAPRLIHTTRMRAWAGWAEHLGVPGDRMGSGTLSFEHYYMVLEAARAGLGVALVPDFLVARDLESGVLTSIRGADWKTGASYWCVTNPSARTSPVTVAFARFIAGLGRAV